MSKETGKTLNTMTLIGNVAKRGYNAWHYRAELQGAEPNHYDGAIPVEDVRRRLFNFEAVEQPIFVGIRDAEGNIVRYIEQTDRKAIVRNDNNHVMGVFKDSYAIHQFDQWLIENVSTIIDDKNLVIDSAGCLREGAIAWVTIASPDNLETSAGFPVRPYILATTSHNGTISTTYKQVYNAPVCDNTLFAGLREDGATSRTRHSKHSVSRIQGIRDAMDIVFSMGEDIVAEIERLGSISVTDREWDAIVNRLVPIGAVGDVPQSAISKMENKQEILRQMYRNDPMVAPWSGSALGVLQAFNTYTHHVSGKNDNRAERNAMSAINGKIQQEDAKVLEVLNELVLA
jgi:phage/plasmid-like protein (TIGR03299 family)